MDNLFFTAVWFCSEFLNCIGLQWKKEPPLRVKITETSLVSTKQQFNYYSI
jgi:hypothetical protein